MTLRGYGYFGGATLLLLFGLLATAGNIATLGLALFTVATLGWIWTSWQLRKVEVYLLGPREKFAGREVQLTAVVRNDHAILPAMALRVEVRLADQQADFFCTSLPCGQSQAKKLIFSLINRVDGADVAVVIESAWPLGLFRHRRRIPSNYWLTVFPRPIVPPVLRADQTASSAAADLTVFQPLRGDEPGALRPFAPGDASHQLHWPTTIRALASGRQPIVRDFDPPGALPSAVRVIMHSASASDDRTMVRPDQFERALSLIVGAVENLRSQGLQVSLQTDWADWKVLPCGRDADWRVTLRLLTRAKRESHSTTHELANACRSVPPSTLLVILSDLPLATWQKEVPKSALLIDLENHRYGLQSMKTGR